MRTMRAVGSHPVVRHPIGAPLWGRQFFRAFAPGLMEWLKFVGRTIRRNGKVGFLFGKYLPDTRILPKSRLTSFET